MTRREAVPLLAVGLTSIAPVAHAQPSQPRIRVALSETMVRDLNPNDSRAAMRAWADSLARETGFQVSLQTLNQDRDFVARTPDLFEAVRRFLVDAFAITVPEYIQLSQYADPRTIMVDEITLRGGHELIILVHRQRGIPNLAGLKGRQLTIHSSPRTAIVPAWLDSLTAEWAPSGFESFLGAVSYQPKLSKAVLPVFFQQSDACAIERRAFLTMCELNPQLQRDLTILAKSPPMAASMLAFHRQLAVPVRDAFCKALTSLHGTAAGKQALTLFQSGPLVLGDESVLRNAIRIVEVSEKLRARRPRG